VLATIELRSTERVGDRPYARRIAPMVVPDPADAYLLDGGWTWLATGLPDEFLDLSPPVVDIGPRRLRSDLRNDASIGERSLGHVCDRYPRLPPVDQFATPGSVWRPRRLALRGLRPRHPVR
jgi:hypothetical protein